MTASALRVPVIIPPATLLKTFADRQAANGLRLVTDGKLIYLTPMILPGEFPVLRKVPA